jgi:hypothetical protein
MPDELTYTTQVRQTDALGILKLEGSVMGTRDYIDEQLTGIVDDAVAGDSITITWIVELPEGHPLVGIDLGGLHTSS